MTYPLFHAVAFNSKGWTFRITFRHPNWSGVEAAAKTALAKAVAGDAGHQKNGPWDVRSIDRCA